MYFESDKLVEIIKGVQMKSFDKVLKYVNEVKSYKNAGYDNHISKVRDYYRKNQGVHVSRLLYKYLPANAHEMIPSVYNIVNKSADLDANAYRQNPDRKILNDDNLNDEFQKLLPRWPVEAVMHDAEKVLMAAKTMFLRLNWPSSLADELGIKSKPEISIFWPDKVHVVPDPRDLNNIQAAKVVIIDISNNNERVFEVWERIGQIIKVVTFYEGRESTEIEWPLSIMPFVVMHAGLSQNSMYLDIDRDIIETQDDINISLSDNNWSNRYTSHPMIIYKGAHAKAKKLQVNSATVNIIDANTDVSKLDLGVTNDVLSEIETKAKLLGISQRQNADEWSTGDKQAFSGIAREVSNIGSNQKQKEFQKYYKLVEREQLLPLLCRISEVFSDFPSHDNLEFSVKFKENKVYEDPSAKTNRVAIMQDKGWISPATAAVLSDIYSSKEEAVAAGVSDEINLVNGGTGSLKVTQ